MYICTYVYCVCPLLSSYCPRQRVKLPTAKQLNIFLSWHIHIYCYKPTYISIYKLTTTNYILIYNYIYIHTYFQVPYGAATPTLFCYCCWWSASLLLYLAVYFCQTDLQFFALSWILDFQIVTFTKSSC